MPALMALLVFSSIGFFAFYLAASIIARAIHAHVKSKPINVRDNLTIPLPDEATVILIPEDGCQTDWEEPV